MIECKRNKGEIVTYSKGNQKYFLDQFSDNEDEWHGAKNILNYSYFEKNYNITQQQAYDIIMTPNKQCPYCNRKRKFIDYFRGYTNTCGNEECEKKYNAQSYKIFQFITPQGELIEYPRDEYQTVRGFMKYIAQDEHIVCSKCKKHDLVVWRSWTRVPRETFIDKETNREVIRLNANGWKCYNCSISESSSKHMTELHHGNSEIARDFQKRLRNCEWQHKFTKEDCSKGGFAAREKTIAYNKSEYGRENSRRNLTRLWSERYDYMYEQLCKMVKYLWETQRPKMMKHTMKNFISGYSIHNLTQEQFDNTCKQLATYMNDYYNDDTFILDNCLETVASSWFNLVKEWYKKGSKKKITTYFYYAQAKDNEEIYKIGISCKPESRYSKGDRFYNPIPIKEYSNRYICAYIEYKIRTIFCYDNTEITDKENLDLIIDYVNNFKITKRVKQELDYLGLDKKLLKYF